MGLFGPGDGRSRTLVLTSLVRHILDLILETVEGRQMGSVTRGIHLANQLLLDLHVLLLATEPLVHAEEIAHQAAAVAKAIIDRVEGDSSTSGLCSPHWYDERARRLLCETGLGIPTG